jgi:hypothetical protein
MKRDPDQLLYEDFKSKVLQIRPVIALMSFEHWKHEGKLTADEWLLRSRGVDWKTAMTYPNARGWKTTEEPEVEEVEIKPKRKKKDKKKKKGKK